jgi:hypothetical protein
MSRLIPVVTAVAGVVLVLAGTLTACGSPALSSAAAHRSTAGGKAPASPGKSPRAASPPSPSARGVPASPSAEPSPPSPPVAVPPDIVVVRLSTVFSPAVLRLNVGQQFLVTVSKAVQVSGLGFPGCAAGATAQTGGGLLSARCTAGGYLYTAEHAGTAILSAGVRPRCAPGTACPQWIIEASLKITIT